MDNSGGVGLHGLEANLTDEELTARAPLVVRGVVMSAQLMELRDDPFLPSPTTETERAMVEGGYRQLKWEVRVEDWIKGESPGWIFVVRGVGGPGARVGGAAEEEVEARFRFIQPGGRYIFWLSPNEWFQQNHWILSRAAAVP